MVKRLARGAVERVRVGVPVPRRAEPDIPVGLRVVQLGVPGAVAGSVVGVRRLAASSACWPPPCALDDARLGVQVHGGHALATRLPVAVFRPVAGPSAVETDIHRKISSRARYGQGKFAGGDHWKTGEGRGPLSGSGM